MPRRATDSDPGHYKCGLGSCSYTSNRLSDVKRHKASTKHGNIRPFACDICGKAFPQKVTLQSHVKTQHTDSPHKCRKCHRTFSNRVLLYHHKQVHFPWRKYYCVYANCLDTCLKTKGFSKDCLEKHWEECHGKPFQDDRYDLARLRYDHAFKSNGFHYKRSQDSTKRLYICFVKGCTAQCESKDDLSGHLQRAHDLDATLYDLDYFLFFGSATNFVVASNALAGKDSLGLNEQHSRSYQAGAGDVSGNTTAEMVDLSFRQITQQDHFAASVSSAALYENNCQDVRPSDHCSLTSHIPGVQFPSAAPGISSEFHSQRTHPTIAGPRRIVYEAARPVSRDTQPEGISQDWVGLSGTLATHIARLHTDQFDIPLSMENPSVGFTSTEAMVTTYPYPALQPVPTGLLFDGVYPSHLDTVVPRHEDSERHPREPRIISSPNRFAEDARIRRRPALHINSTVSPLYGSQVIPDAQHMYTPQLLPSSDIPRYFSSPMPSASACPLTPVSAQSCEPPRTRTASSYNSTPLYSASSLSGVTPDSINPHSDPVRTLALPPAPSPSLGRGRSIDHDSSRVLSAARSLSQNRRFLSSDRPLPYARPRHRASRSDSHLPTLILGIDDNNAPASAPCTATQLEFYGPNRALDSSTIATERQAESSTSHHALYGLPRHSDHQSHPQQYGNPDYVTSVPSSTAGGSVAPSQFAPYFMSHEDLTEMPDSGTATSLYAQNFMPTGAAPATSNTRQDLSQPQHQGSSQPEQYTPADELTRMQSTVDAEFADPPWPFGTDTACNDTFMTTENKQ